MQLPLPNPKVNDQSFSCRRSLWHQEPLTSLISKDFVSYLMARTIFQQFHTHCLTNTVKKTKYSNLSTWSSKTEDLESPKSSSSSTYIPANAESRWLCFCPDSGSSFSHLDCCCGLFLRASTQLHVAPLLTSCNCAASPTR